MKNIKYACTVVLLTIALFGCATQQSPPPKSPQTLRFEMPITQETVSKVKVGMTVEEVYDIVHFLFLNPEIVRRNSNEEFSLVTTTGNHGYRFVFTKGVLTALTPF